jgi:katanin p80 WD40 repeat-containing subunit B1
VDVLSVLMERTELLTLEICCMLVPLLNGLLNSDNDRNLITALSLLLKLVTTFGPVINTTRASAPSLGVDLQAEQRLERCVMCYHELQTVGHCLLPLMRYFINIGLFVSNSLSNSFVHLQLALDFIF